MSKWKTVKLGDICKFINGDRGKNYPSGKDIVENGIPFINAGHLVSNAISFSDMNYITEEKYNQLGSGKIQKGDFLYCLRGSLGKHAIVENIEKGAVASSLVILRPTNIDVHYLSYCMDSPSISTQLQQANNGSSQPNLSANSVKQYIVPLPPLEEQKRIADILDKASNLIDLRKQQLEKMDLLIKSKFIDMFGDPVTNPKGWDVKQLAELGSWNSGGTPSRVNATYFEGDIEWYSAGELNDLFLKKSNERITNEALKESAAKLFEAGSLLIGMYDTAAFKMGILTKNASSNQACANIKPNKKTNVLWLYFNLLLMKKHFLQNRRGIRQKNLNLGMIKGFYVPVPPTVLQSEFAEFVEQVEKQKAVMQQSLEKMETNYNALMQEYFG